MHFVPFDFNISLYLRCDLDRDVEKVTILLDVFFVFWNADAGYMVIACNVATVASFSNSYFLLVFMLLYHKYY